MRNFSFTKLPKQMILKITSKATNKRKLQKCSISFENLTIKLSHYAVVRKMLV